MENYSPKDFVEENLMKLIREYRLQEQKGEEIAKLIEIGYLKQ